MGKWTSLEKREDVIRHYKEGQESQLKIAEIIAISFSTVQHIIERFCPENRMEDKGRSAPNKIFNDGEKRWIVRRVKEKSGLSASKLTNEVKTYSGKICIPETVCRVLREENFHRRTARNKSLMNARNRKQRI